MKPNNLKISIVTSYFNRKNLLVNTLKSISLSEYKNFEVIIVDDGSSEEHRIEDLVEVYPFIKIIRIEPEDKWYINPCVPFNKGFKEISGDIVIIQNPECFHKGDILSYVNENLTENDYLVFGCYSLDKSKTNHILENIENHNNITFNNKGASFNGQDSWYNHSIYRPFAYHFTSAMFKTKLNELNGFDERYAMGHGWDDNEFLHRIRKICNVKMIDNPLVLHQYHYDIISNTQKKNVVLEDNRKLFLGYTLKENKIKVNL
jgi:glycosyltransferase involved in cell wall biosynthesis